MTLLNLNRFPVLKSLFLESNEITKIDGLENCHEIRHLVLDRNRIKDIEPGALIGQWRLEELHIDGNRLTTLGNLRHLVNLKRLYIGLNRIQEIAEISKLSALVNLTEISMIGNGVARRMLHRLVILIFVAFVQTNILDQCWCGSVQIFILLMEYVSICLRDKTLNFISWKRDMNQYFRSLIRFIQLHQ